VPIGQPAATGNVAPMVSQPPTSSVSSSSFVSKENNTSLTELSGFYVAPELGVAFQQDVNLQNVNFDTTILGADVVGSAGGSLTMSAGIRFNLPIGYQPVDWFAVEFAPGIIWNKMSSYNLELNGSLDGTAVSTTLPLNVEGGYFQVPLVVNFIFKIPTNSPWVPYIGGGIGASYTYMNWTRLSYAGVSADLSNVDGSCWSLAYQGIAGLDYKITDEVSLGLKYIFLGTGNQNFGGSFQDVDTKGSYSQNVMLNCTINF
jgi:opacity protein-like surface antigen